MAAPTSDWGDLFNQHHKGGERYTMVMMFVGGVVPVFAGFLYYSYCRKPMGQEFFVPARTKIVVELLIEFLPIIICALGHAVDTFTHS